MGAPRAERCAKVDTSRFGERPECVRCAIPYADEGSPGRLEQILERRVAELVSQMKEKRDVERLKAAESLGERSRHHAARAGSQAGTHDDASTRALSERRERESSFPDRGRRDIGVCKPSFDRRAQ